MITINLYLRQLLPQCDPCFPNPDDPDTIRYPYIAGGGAPSEVVDLPLGVSPASLGLESIPGIITNGWAGFTLSDASGWETTIGGKGADSSSETVPLPAVARLANLNVALYECEAKLPSTDKSRGNTGTRDVRSPRKTVILAIDDIFRLTSEFTALVQSLFLVGYERINPPSTPTPEKPPTLWELSPSMRSHQRSEADLLLAEADIRPAEGPCSRTDEASFLMVMSCHCRLVEIYMSIFQMMRACIEHSRVPQPGRDWAVILPQLKMGSFASPQLQVDIDSQIPAVTSSVYMSMITMLSSQLWEQLGGALRTGSYNAVSDAMWDTVTDRTDHILQTINVTRGLLHLGS
ncbi:Uu.00g023610.m01.CDS01 [Anthostomella pinea]|uniref:Uu.00g023610.m01.CDS01 n=1 Tax=Anthostomella pinea TaxID=933095 RepID=A0AAI8W058_9PEZI|nr:Uu.00g023610.m01.CDS01 [Anthostomella pinea]